MSGPQYGGGGSGATLVGDEGISNYNGLVVTVQHRLSSTFSLLANYTWSKCLNENDASGDVSTTSVSNPSNPALDYGPCGSDYRNIENIVLVLQSRFAIPNHYVKAIVNGWELAPLIHVVSGGSFSIGASVDNSFTDIGQDRPNIVPGVPIYIKQQILVNASTHAYLNPLAFCSQPTKTNPCTNPVAQGGYGTESRNALRGLPSYQFDAQVSPDLPHPRTPERNLASGGIQCPQSPKLQQSNDIPDFLYIWPDLRQLSRPNLPRLREVQLLRKALNKFWF